MVIPFISSSSDCLFNAAFVFQRMGLCFVLITLASLAITFGEVAEKTTYTTKYDNIDLDEIIHNDRLLKNYVDCLLEKGRCTPDGLELKSTYLTVIILHQQINISSSKIRFYRKHARRYRIRLQQM